MKVLVRQLVEMDVPRSKIESKLLKEFQLASINSVTFNSIIDDARNHVGYRSDGHEVAGLVHWMQNNENKFAHYQIGVDADLRCNKLFFINQSMIVDSKRIGQVLIMDCTCKTNRFGWALFICVGVNQHLKTVLLSETLQKAEESLLTHVIFRGNSADPFEPINDGLLPSSLQQLELDYNQIRDDDAKAMATALQHNISSATLSLE